VTSTQILLLEARIAELTDEVAGWLEIARSEGARSKALTAALRRIADEQNPRAAMNFKDAIAIAQDALASGKDKP
jgi:hypothetical protein